MKKLSYILSWLLLTFVLVANAVTGDEGYNEFTIRPSDIPADAPRFESYPASVYSGPNASPNLKADPKTRMFRTKIKEWSKVKPNFAGHYILATWGCGSDCIQIAIIDAKTGRVFHPEGISTNASTNVHANLLENSTDWYGTGSVWHRADSELLVLIGMPEEDTKRRGISYYKWQNNRLSLVRFVPKA